MSIPIQSELCLSLQIYRFNEYKLCLQFKNLIIYTRLDLQFYLLFHHSKTEITGYWEYRYVLSLSFCTISHGKQSRRYLEGCSVLE